MQPVFVSIDPQRDTPQSLREYVQSFDARILPLSGNAEQLARAAGSLGVVFYKEPGPTPDEYTFAHNAIVTLVGPEGGIVTRERRGSRRPRSGATPADRSGQLLTQPKSRGC